MPPQSLKPTPSSATAADDSISIASDPDHVPESSRHCRNYTDVTSVNAIDDSSSSTESTQSIVVATKAALHELILTHPLPGAGESVWCNRYNQLRYGVCSAYRRICTTVILINLVAVITMTSLILRHSKSITYENAGTATGANLMLAALTRQEHVINLLFEVACALPSSVPLSIRRTAAKVYSYGGIHSGCGISALFWYLYYTILVIRHFKDTSGESTALTATSAAALLCLIVIVGMAYPSIRTRWHDQWEISHRYCGWTAVALVWAQTLVVVTAEAHESNQPMGITLARNSNFWFLVVITLCLVYPWLRLRRRAIVPEKLSAHAIRLHLNDTQLPSCVGYRLSHNPLVENHGFATIPNMADEEMGYSILVSQAGDWTRALIDNPPTHIWTRGAPTTGVMRVASLFSPIIVVATGSGIGPCLSFLQVHPDHPMRVLWSARDPANTYGTKIVNAVLRADKDAIIVDRNMMKERVDLLALSYALFKAARAEAVVVISNPATTKEVVFGLESRKVTAFGAIFDS